MEGRTLVMKLVENIFDQWGWVDGDDALEMQSVANMTHELEIRNKHRMARSCCRLLTGAKRTVNSSDTNHRLAEKRTRMFGFRIRATLGIDFPVFFLL